MATSGTSDYNNTRDQIISLAMQEIGVLEAGRTITDADLANDVAYAAELLNQEIKHFQNDAKHLWKRQVGYIVPEANKSSYQAGNATSSNKILTRISHTAVNGAVAAAATTVVVDSNVNITSGDIIAFGLAGGAKEFKVVDAVNGDGVTITLTAGLTNALLDDAVVINATEEIKRPLHIYNAWVETLGINQIQRREIETVAVTDFYTKYGSLSTNGEPTILCYNRQHRYNTTVQNISGEFLISPTPTNNNIVVGFLYQAPLEDFDAAGDNPDFPNEWLKVITLGLALRLTNSFTIPDNLYQRLSAQYMLARDEALTFDADFDPIYIQPWPDRGYY